ncbi:MAG: PorT family protein [Candidatus Eisenbacteria bacterium]|nr:PorT family protein [Candidatus Eisenbacteria bacterium]
MKLLSTLIVATALIAIAASGACAEGFAIGFKGGVTATSVYGDLSDRYEHKLCVAGGVFLSVSLSERVGLQGELLYVRKGANVSDSDGLAVWLDYVEVPMLVKVSLPVGESFVPNLFVGPALGFNVRAESGVGDDFENLERYVSDTDVSIVVGAGFDHQLGGASLVGDIRYEFGLMNVNDEDAFVGDVASQKNHGIVAMVGIAFSL